MKMGKRCPALVQPCNPWGLLQTYFTLVSLCVTTISGTYEGQSNILPEDIEPSSFTGSSTPSSPPTTATFSMVCFPPHLDAYVNDHCWLDDNTLVIVDFLGSKVLKATVNRTTKNCTYSYYSDSPGGLRVSCSPDGKEIYVVNHEENAVWVYDENSLKAIWKPEGMVGSPFNVAVNINSVIVGTEAKGPLYVYDRNRVYQGQISISQNQFWFDFTHLTEEGVFVASTNVDKLVIHDIPDNSTVITGGTGSGDGQLSRPFDVTTVGHYILVCDVLNDRVPVFAQNGDFQSNLQFKDAEESVAKTIAYRSESKLLSLSFVYSSYIKIYTLT